MFSVFSVKKKGRKGCFYFGSMVFVSLEKTPTSAYNLNLVIMGGLFSLSQANEWLTMYIRWLVKKDGWLGWDNYTVEMILYLLLLFSRSHLILIRNFNSVLQCHWQHDFEVRILSARGRGGGACNWWQH